MPSRVPLKSVGTIELVSLPDAGIADVPAKIDTGADSSAIWATDIVEHAGQVSFVLFAKISPLYTGKIITTSDYSVVSIVNSFGQSEHRYKTTLKLKLAGRTIRANVTLADRQHNRYPILIGRRTLHGKFLVDVTRKAAQEQSHILMLSTARTKRMENFAKNLEKKTPHFRITNAAYEDLCFTMGGEGNHISLLATDRDIASFDLVYFKTTSKYMDIAAATACYLKTRRIKFIDQAIRHFSGSSKLYQYVKLTDQGALMVPQSIFMFSSRMIEAYSYLSSSLGLPFILKDIHANRGEFNFLIGDEASFREACKKALDSGIHCVAQTFIPNTCDYRILVFGSKIGLVMERTRNTNATHLNNTSQGASSKVVDTSVLPSEIQMASIAAAKRMERQIAGVDIIQDKNSGLWYCLEVNDGPHLASGSLIAEKQTALTNYLNRITS